MHLTDISKTTQFKSSKKFKHKACKTNYKLINNNKINAYNLKILNYLYIFK